MYEEFYCVSCNLKVCVDCIDRKHYDHELRKLKTDNVAIEKVLGKI